jgi:hypothetical protein
MPLKSKPIKKEDLAIYMLDEKHTDFMKRFAHENTILIPKLEKECLMETNPSKQKNLLKRIKAIQNSQLEYYLTNSNHIFSYFENKKDISECKSKVKILHQFFNPDKKIDEVSETLTTHSLEYLKNIDEAFLSSDTYIYNTAICKKCNQGELIHVDYEGVMICNNEKCSCQFQLLIENEKPSYKDPPNEICFYAYKRINHFREILAQFQAKETTQIPEDILENILSQIKKERIPIESITNKKTKEILKKFGYNKYYEHIPFIKDKLGIKPPVMSPELEEKLCSLFMEIQRPYAKFCPEDRVNFLNYYYTIYKLCELLEEDEFLPYFPMLKDREKRIEQDAIWKNICEDLNWEFIPTV